MCLRMLGRRFGATWAADGADGGDEAGNKYYRLSGC